jgi:hypothetical protein
MKCREKRQKRIYVHKKEKSIMQEGAPGMPLYSAAAVE